MKKSLGIVLLLATSYQAAANIPVSQCRGDNLNIHLAKTDAAMSKYVYYYNVKNTSSRPCMIAGKPIINAVAPSGNVVRLPISNSSYFDQLTAHKTLLLAAGKQAWFSIVGNRSQAAEHSTPAQLYQKIQFSLSPTTTVLSDLPNIAVTDNVVVTPYQRGAAPQ